MLLMMACRGHRFRKERSYSHASATKYSESPTPDPPPSCGTSPPMTKLGSTPSSRKARAIMAVMVVLPCVPATAIPVRSRIRMPNILAYLMTGMPRNWAAMRSGLLSLTAAL
jgi:hypothetical protein